EKLFVGTDKWFYSAGENIWFKVFMLDAVSLRPIHEGKNLFLDLVNDKDSVISQALLNVGERRMSGSILLPPNLKEGYYWIRAYTRNILLHDSNGIFIKPVYVINAGNPDPRSLTEAYNKTVVDAEDTSAPRLLFYPEGGSIIAGTTATIAFRALNARGEPLEVSGWVTDTRDSIATNFKTTLPGLGKFSFDAWNPRKYFAHIKWKNNRVITYPLPHIDQFASQLSLTEQNSQTIKVRVSLGDSLYNKNKKTFLLGISRDSLCFAASGTNMYDVQIPKSNFPKGRATLFLFNEEKEIVSERSIYIDTGFTRVVVETDKSVYGPREKVKLNLNSSSSEGHPLGALFTVSVTDDRFSSPLTEQDIFIGFNPDHIELPETGTSAGTDWENKYSLQDIDLIMLMQKKLYANWNFNTSDAQANAPYPYADVDSNLLAVKGKIEGKGNKPVGGCLVYLQSKTKSIFQNDTTDENGHFQFYVGDFDDGERFDLKVTNLKGNGIEGRVVLENLGFPRFATPGQLKRRFDKSDLNIIRHFKTRQPDSTLFANDNRLLKPVNVKGTKTKGAPYDQSKRVSTTSYIITSDQLSTGDPNALVNAIRNVPGLYTGATSSGMTSNYLLLLDGVDANTDMLTSVNPLQVDFIEVLRGPETAYYGMQGSDGVILVNTINKTKEVTTVDDKGTAVIFPKGYFKKTEFPSPDYDKKEKNKNASYPDLRNTIYWNGDLQTDNNGKVGVVFFTADASATYTATVLGITATGELVYKQIKIKRQ
ncbi:MAG TPA: TonB-dependent receptor plug domain-containing protein, partial [Puia sp.]|nr:TonB-dependent receptor plug domain-containing protein [Puia sp.]